MTDFAARQKAGRRSAIEVAERVAFVRELVKVHREDRAKIHADYLDFYGPTPARTIDEYVSRVHRQWLRDADERAPDERAAFLAKLDADVKLYAEHKAWSAHASARKLQARVLGLDVQHVDVRGGLTLTPGRPPEDEPLSEHELELAAVVIEQTRAARALPAAPVGDATDAEPAKDAESATHATDAAPKVTP